MKILIENHWEVIIDLYDISRVIRQYYNSELADELDKLIDEGDLSGSQLQRLTELEEMVEDIRRIVM